MRDKVITDIEVKKRFFSLEEMQNVSGLLIRGYSVYSILRFALELDFRSGNHKPLAAKRPLQRTKSRVKKVLKGIQKRLNASTQKQVVPSRSRFLFVSTSDWVTPEGHSIELADIIEFYRSRDEVINFVQSRPSERIIKENYDSYIDLDPEKRTPLSASEKDSVEMFLQIASTEFGFDFTELGSKYIDYTEYVLAMAGQLQDIIEVCQPAFVFARSVYSEPWIPIACSRTRKTCVEVQHGVINPDNVYYQNSPGSFACHRKLLPGYILTLGKKWTEIILRQNNDYSHKSVLTLGSPMVRSFHPKRKNQFTILVCMQHGVFNFDDLLSDFLEKYYAQLSEENFYVNLRPHPHSIAETTNKYKQYAGKTFGITNSREVDFLNDLETAGVVLSASSMCLYEALAFAIPAVSLTKFRGVTINTDITYISTADDLWEQIQDISNGKYSLQVTEYLSEINDNSLRHFLDIPAINKNEALKHKLPS